MHDIQIDMLRIIGENPAYSAYRDIRFCICQAQINMEYELKTLPMWVRRSGRVCLGPFHKTENAITGILQAPIKWQIYIHPARLTFHFRPGSCAVRDVLIHETDIVGCQGEIQRACPRRGDKDLERADL